MLFLVLAVLTTFCLIYVFQHWGPAHFEYRHYLNKDKINFGETIEYKQVFTNRKALPLPWVTVETEFTKGVHFLKGTVSPHYLSSKEFLAGLVSTLWYEKVTRTYPVLCNNRGVYYFGPTKLTFGDVIGLSDTRTKIEDDLARVIVYPRILEVKIRNNHSLDLGGKKDRQNFTFQDPYSFAGTRDYLPGDSPRAINWKASARLNNLRVNVYNAATSPKTSVFLNITTSDQPWIIENIDAFELAVITAASVCHKAIMEGSEVMLAGNYRTMTKEMNTDLTTVIPFGRGVEHLRILLESLARLYPYGHEAVERVILKVLAKIPRETKLVLVTSYLNEILIDVLEKVKIHGINVMLVLVGNKYIDAPGIPGMETYRAGGEENWREMDALRLV